VIVRDAEPSEYERVGELTIAAYRALPVDHLWGGYAAEILDVAGRAEGCDIIVATDDDGTVVGAVTLVLDRASPWHEWAEADEVQFRLLAVDTAARGRGAGEALVRECVARAADRTVLIHTTQWMEAAQRLYARLGFVARPDRNVQYKEWHDPARDHDLPREWIGVPFLAYSSAAANRAG
jgi:GNAT superfamily N-acetyltransferase